MKYILSILFFVFSNLIYSDGFEKNETETTNIKGVVVDEKTGERLPGVCVKLNDKDTEVLTDLNGEFIIKDVLVGEYDIISTFISYETNIIHNVDINSKLVIKMISK